jgi:protein PhnA
MRQQFRVPLSMDILEVKDCNGNLLAEGDNVVVTKELKVKGIAMTIKMGTTVKKIRLTDDPEEVDCKINGTSIVLKTCFLKKA